MSGTGDATLYVRWGAQATSTAYHCRSQTKGTTTERYTPVVPAGQSQAWIWVEGQAKNSRCTLQVTYTTP